MALKYLVRRPLVNSSFVQITDPGTIIDTIEEIPSAQQDRVIVYDDGEAVPILAIKAWGK